MAQLSIITINYNNLVGLEKTICSVLEQTFKDFEYIIIDGGSTDGSKEFVETRAAHFTYWLSEKDNGIYHAMNKGIEKATGTYIMFLNSGDYLINHDILRTIAPELNKEDIIYGDLLIEEPAKTWTKTYPDVLHFDYFIYDSLPHSAGIFIKKTAFNALLARYDESLKIVSDWKWFLTAIFKFNYTYKHISKTIGVFDFSGISASNPMQLQEEKAKVLLSEFKEIYREISTLSVFKTKYETLYSSRAVQFYLKLKSLIS